MGKTGKNTLITYESGTTEVKGMMEDSGDHTVFTGDAKVWSADAGKEPVILPDGIASGTNILSPHDDDDKLSFTGFTAYIAGALKTVTAGTITISRASSDTHKRNSITYNGATVVVVAGAEGTSFSDTRGEAGAPPLIPVGSVEIGVISTDSQTSAPILATEISQDPAANTQERYDVPVIVAKDGLGYGVEAATSAEKNAHIAFAKPLELLHTGGVAKGVFHVVHEPDFAEVEESDEWKPAEETPSSSSKQIYRKTTASTSRSLGTASFKLFYDDPVMDPLRQKDGATLTFKVYADYNLAPYQLTQGEIGFSSSNPVAEDMNATCTIAAKTKTRGFDV